VSEESVWELLGRLRKIASQLPGVAYQFRLRPDGTSCFPYASDRMRDICRVSPEDVAEDASPIFASIHPDDHAAVMAAILTSAETLAPWRQEYRVQFPGGDVRWLSGNAVPEREADGSVLWHGFLSDSTEQRATRDAKDQLEAQLRQAQKVESIGRLAGGVAHDFNNLLTSVLGFATIAKDKLPLGSPAARDLDRVIESAERGAGLTQQLLAFARRRMIKAEVINLYGVLARIGPMIRRLVGEHIELTVDADPHLRPVKIDVGGIEQLVMNLSLNARDAMPSGGLLTIRASNVTLDEAAAEAMIDVGAGPHVQIAVEDTGAGMSPDVLARVFEPFFTTKPTGQGTGLGLAVCHGIVRQAGGHIRVHSTEGLGTTVEIFLPQVDEPVRSPRPLAAARVTPRGTETLLVVEDDAAILMLVTQTLSRLGYNVLSAPDGLTAFELYGHADFPIHLLVTDVVMPRMGGNELAARLTALRPGLKVLFASGYSEDAVTRHGVSQADVHFIQKPFTPVSLAERIRHVIDEPE
jgi:two-component system, cell cycle sensor histidine kinase and response regulator CckA